NANNVVVGTGQVSGTIALVLSNDAGMTITSDALPATVFINEEGELFVVNPGTGVAVDMGIEPWGRSGRGLHEPGLRGAQREDLLQSTVQGRSSFPSLSVVLSRCAPSTLCEGMEAWSSWTGSWSGPPTGHTQTHKPGPSGPRGAAYTKGCGSTSDKRKMKWPAVAMPLRPFERSGILGAYACQQSQLYKKNDAPLVHDQAVENNEGLHPRRAQTKNA